MADAQLSQGAVGIILAEYHLAGAGKLHLIPEHFDASVGHAELPQQGRHITDEVALCVRRACCKLDARHDRLRIEPPDVER